MSKLQWSAANNQKERTTNGDPMKKLSFLLVVLGSALAAFGFSGWQAITQTNFSPNSTSMHEFYWAGWPPLSQIEITVGVMLLVCGLLLRRDEQPNAP